MSKHLLTGRAGEEAAARYLEAKGYKIVERNYRYARAEIDIIAKKDNFTVFLEVKTRSSDQFGYPEEAVDPAKENRIQQAAEHYLSLQADDCFIRFDIIAVQVKSGKNMVIEHFEDAF